VGNLLQNLKAECFYVYYPNTVEESTHKPPTPFSVIPNVVFFSYLYIHFYFCLKIEGIHSYGLEGRVVGFQVPVRARFFSSPSRPDQSYIIDAGGKGTGA
jgi:hypothetical protein